MEYTGKFRKMYSTLFNKNVSVLEYRSKEKFPYCDCSRCGKPIVKLMYIVQDDDTDVELMYLGSECIKHFS